MPMPFFKADRLPRGLGPEWFLRQRFGDWVARPWFDRAALGSLGWYFPVSRLWAAASVADGDPERFAAELPAVDASAPDGWLVEQALTGVSEAYKRYERVCGKWEEMFFSGGVPEMSELVAAELERRTAARIWMASRGLMLPMMAGNSVPAVRLNIPSGERMSAEFDTAAGDPAKFYRPPDPLPVVEKSYKAAGPEGYEYWLRFPSPGDATRDTAWAKVYEPDAMRAGAPTFIYCHGLAVETEMWGSTAGVPFLLLRAGARIVVLEAPWHNRRMVPGFWGGEQMIATAPRGAIDLFQAALGEIAMLIDWARRQGSQVVALGGTSLGALTSQLAAAQGVHWPARLRPDVLYLVATGGSVRQVAVDSELADIFRLREALEEAGWSAEMLDRYKPLTDPLGPPAMKPDRIVMVLGRADSVTRYDEGARLAERWEVPQSNLFVRDQGHFSVPLGLMHDNAPLRRLLELMG